MIFHFKLNWFILLFSIAIRCSMCLISWILLINISIDGIVFKHLQAYRYCLVMMNIRLNKSWYWKSVIPNNCSFSVNWIYIPVSVCNFTNNLFQMSWLCLHFTNKCRILSGCSSQNVERSACIIFHLNKWVLVITAWFKVCIENLLILWIWCICVCFGNNKRMYLVVMLYWDL